MSPSEHPGQGDSRWAWPCIAGGAYLLGIGSGIVPVDAAAVHAPPWVILLCGASFLLAGTMILARQRSRVVRLCAVLLLLCLGLTGAWVALFGAASAFSGGMPFLAREANVLVARVLFGSGAVVVLALAAHALRRPRAQRP